MSISNLPPPDELASVRAQIKALTGRESELRNLLLADPGAREGNSYLALVLDFEQSRVDIKELRKMHPDIAAEFTFPVKTQTIVLHGITEDGEIVPAKRLEKAQSS